MENSPKNLSNNGKFANWDSQFVDFFRQMTEHFRQCNCGFDELKKQFSPAHRALLEHIGYTEREFFDFVEDFGNDAVLSEQAVLQIAAVRRDYFHWVLAGKKNPQKINPAELPPRDAELAGMVWLPRIIAKARAKLHGTLDDSTMFCCGGDRKFLRRHQLHPADFLRVVWKAERDESDAAIIDFVKKSSANLS